MIRTLTCRYILVFGLFLTYLFMLAPVVCRHFDEHQENLSWLLIECEEGEETDDHDKLVCFFHPVHLSFRPFLYYHQDHHEILEHENLLLPSHTRSPPISV